MAKGKMIPIPKPAKGSDSDYYQKGKTPATKPPKITGRDTGKKK